MATRRASRKGGKKTRKIGRKAGEWSKKVMAVYRELKAKRKDVRLMDAMKEASRRKAAGTL
jgi:hypothetical protein